MRASIPAITSMELQIRRLRDLEEGLREARSKVLSQSFWRWAWDKAQIVADERRRISLLLKRAKVIEKKAMAHVTS